VDIAYRLHTTTNDALIINQQKEVIFAKETPLPYHDIFTPLSSLVLGAIFERKALSNPWGITMKDMVGSAITLGKTHFLWTEQKITISLMNGRSVDCHYHHKYPLTFLGREHLSVFDEGDTLIVFKPGKHFYLSIMDVYQRFDAEVKQSPREVYVHFQRNGNEIVIGGKRIQKLSNQFYCEDEEIKQ
jgi:hypothetical protein